MVGLGLTCGLLMFLWVLLVHWLVQWLPLLGTGNKLLGNSFLLQDGLWVSLKLGFLELLGNSLVLLDVLLSLNLWDWLKFLGKFVLVVSPYLDHPLHVLGVPALNPGKCSSVSVSAILNRKAVSSGVVDESMWVIPDVEQLVGWLVLKEIGFLV
jgi:hypothetical protein